MATERQIRANRANALKSTGPVTAEGKRISSQNSSLHRLLSTVPVPEGESRPRYDRIAAALTLQFRPRNSVETALIHSMTLARWHQSTLWGTQAAALRHEMQRDRPKNPAAPADPLAAAFRSLAENSRSFVRQHRLEAHYDRQYNRALAKLLKQKFQTEANSAAASVRIATGSDS